MTETSESILREMLRWIRASSYASVRKLLDDEFRKAGDLDAKRAKIYQLSDGNTTSVDIAKKSPASQSFVSTLWKHWRQIGIAEPAGEGGRQTRRCFSLEDFGFVDGKTKEHETNG